MGSSKTGFRIIGKVEGTAATTNGLMYRHTNFYNLLVANAKYNDVYNNMTKRNEVHMNGHLKVLSGRWNAYNDVQEEIKKRLREQEKLAEDPYGDGIPF